MIKFFFFMLFFISCGVYSQSLVKESSASDIINKRDLQIRIIRNIDIDSASIFLLDALMDSDINAYSSDDKGFVIFKLMICKSNKINPFENMLPKHVQIALKRIGKSQAYLKGKVILEQRGADVLVRFQIDPIKCSRDGILDQDERSLSNVFWSNLSTSLFIDGIRLLALEVN